MKMMTALFSNPQIVDLVESNRNANRRLRDQVVALSDELTETRLNLKICREKNKELRDTLLLSHYVTLSFVVLIAVWVLNLVTSFR